MYLKNRIEREKKGQENFIIIQKKICCCGEIDLRLLTLGSVFSLVGRLLIKKREY